MHERYFGIRVSVISHILQYCGVVLLISVTTALLKLTFTGLEIQIIALLFLLPVMIATIAWGLGPGILAAFLSFLAFNYFFIAPFYTLLVHQTRDLILLFIFLIVSGVMSQLIGKAKMNERLAKQRERDSTRLYELTASLAGSQDLASAGKILANQIREVFDCSHVKLSLRPVQSDVVLDVLTPNTEPGSVVSPQVIDFSSNDHFSGKLSIWTEKGAMSSSDIRLLRELVNQGRNAFERILLEERTNKLKVLEESDNVKTSLLNSVSHELRSPLAAIKASVSSLRGGGVVWTSSDREELLATIEEETDHLNFLVGNLLDMTRIESGSLRPNIRLNSISEIVSSAIQKSHSLLASHVVVYDFPHDLPPVPTDFVMMVQVFVNLISNSVKYAPSHTRIQLTAKVDANQMHILLINQSPRIPEKDLPRIFEKFYRVTEADKTTGTGLGLSICKGIILAHGGTITAENLLGGFQFRIVMPLMAHESNSVQESGV